MVKGNSKGADMLESMFRGKPYKEQVKDLVKSTVVRAGDFDSKAISLLDVLDAQGKSTQALASLKASLATYSRDKVHNWRAYVYTLLRAYDKDAYALMKDEKGETNKPLGRREKRHERKVKEDGQRHVEDGTAPQPIQFNSGAAEFVPGQSTWSGVQEKSFNSKAVEFQPGKPWEGASETQPASKLSAVSPEFVPGQTTGWTEEASRAAAMQEYMRAYAGAYQQHMTAAMAAAAAGATGFRPSAPPFVPTLSNQDNKARNSNTTNGNAADKKRVAGPKATPKTPGPVGKAAGPGPRPEAGGKGKGGQAGSSPTKKDTKNGGQKEKDIETEKKAPASTPKKKDNKIVEAAKPEKVEPASASTTAASETSKNNKQQQQPEQGFPPALWIGVAVAVVVAALVALRRRR